MPTKKVAKKVEAVAEPTPVAEEAKTAAAPAEAPFTAEQFREELARLVDRAYAAGLNPVQIMLSVYASRSISTYAEKGRMALDTFLEVLDGPPKKKS